MTECLKFYPSQTWWDDAEHLRHITVVMTEILQSERLDSATEFIHIHN